MLRTTFDMMKHNPDQAIRILNGEGKLDFDLTWADGVTKDMLKNNPLFSEQITKALFPDAPEKKKPLEDSEDEQLVKRRPKLFEIKLPSIDDLPGALINYITGNANNNLLDFQHDLAIQVNPDQRFNYVKATILIALARLNINDGLRDLITILTHRFAEDNDFVNIIKNRIGEIQNAAFCVVLNAIREFILAGLQILNN